MLKKKCIRTSRKGIRLEGFPLASTSGWDLKAMWKRSPLGGEFLRSVCRGMVTCKERAYCVQQCGRGPRELVECSEWVWRGELRPVSLFHTEFSASELHRSRQTSTFASFHTFLECSHQFHIACAPRSSPPSFLAYRFPRIHLNTSLPPTHTCSWNS